MFGIALNVDEVAELLRVSRHTVYRLAQRGDLPGRKIGRIWRFSRLGVEQYLYGDARPDQADSAGSAQENLVDDLSVTDHPPARTESGDS